MSEPVSDLLLWDAAKVAEALGGIPVSTVQYLAREGRIPSIVIGRRVMFEPSSIKKKVAELVAAAEADLGRDARTL